MRFVELFAGIGGFSLGFERAGLECVGHVEIDKYAQKVLLKHWPKVKLLSDVTKVKGDEFGKVDVLCGGFPCQDISVAGNQKGLHDEEGNQTRSGLYDEIIRIAGVCRPRYIVLENVANLLNKPEWFGYVLGRLAQIGYDAEWQIIRASDFGSPQQRARIFIVAYPSGQRLERRKQGRGSIQITTKKASTQFGNRSVSCGSIWPSPPGNIRVGDGIPNRAHRIKCLGNSLVPQIAEFIGLQLLRRG